MVKISSIFYSPSQVPTTVWTHWAFLLLHLLLMYVYIRTGKVLDISRNSNHDHNLNRSMFVDWVYTKNEAGHSNKLTDYNYKMEKTVVRFT